jgi:imidazolonepropionase-like amidohydrolase
VFDGEVLHEGWAVRVSGSRIEAAGPAASVSSANARVVDLAGATLLPGLVEGHSHILLHPYNETPWADQVLREGVALRAARAVNHLRATLMAGFTTVRDLGTEGAGYADVELRQAVEQGIVPGPRILTSTRAIVATGAYEPKGFVPAFLVPQGAEEADGVEGLTRAVRSQIGRGAQWIKLYGDYRWGPHAGDHPTFSLAELKAAVEAAHSAGVPVSVHASSPEGMKRAAMAGVESIEHGNHGTREVFRLMKERGVAYCPTLAASDATAQYAGWKKGSQPEPERIVQKRASFRAALESGVTILAGSDVGVFAHGDNARELEIMAEYGMAPVDVLRSATSVAGRVLKMDIGRVRAGMLADLIAVDGDPMKKIPDLRRVRMVMKNGAIVR